MAFPRRVVRTIRWWLPLAVTLGLAAAGLGASSGAAAASPASPAWTVRPAGTGAPAWSAPLVVRTDKGTVRGLYASGAREFFGIPYAAPPVAVLGHPAGHPGTGAGRDRPGVVSAVRRRP